MKNETTQIELTEDQIIVEKNIIPSGAASSSKKQEPAGEDAGGESSENDG